MLDKYEQLKALVAQVEDDVRKAAGGNKAAGTRVRKQLQEIKNVAQELRVKVLEGREGEDQGEGAGDSAAASPPAGQP